MLKWAFWVCALANTLVEGALGHKAVFVLVEIRAVVPIHTGTTQPMLANFQLQHAVLGKDMALRALLPILAGALLVRLADFLSLLRARLRRRQLRFKRKRDTFGGIHEC